MNGMRSPNVRDEDPLVGLGADEEDDLQSRHAQREHRTVGLGDAHELAEHVLAHAEAERRIDVWKAAGPRREAVHQPVQRQLHAII
jgi:hypothetical protein